MQQVLSSLGGHPRLEYLILGMEAYPTDQTRFHYHFVLKYSTRIHLKFEEVRNATGIYSDVRYLKDASAIASACTYSVKGCRGLVYPIARTAFVQRVTPKPVTFSEMPVAEMESLVEGPAFDHAMFHPQAPVLVTGDAFKDEEDRIPLSPSAPAVAPSKDVLRAKSHLVRYRQLHLTQK